MSVAAVIVTHNSAAAVTECLAHLKGLDEIVVVDNASSDHTVEAVRHTAPHARLIAKLLAHRQGRNTAFTFARLWPTLVREKLLRELIMRTRVGLPDGLFAEA